MNNKWEPNEADLDLILVQCDCGWKFKLPWDVMAFGFLKDLCCGKCGELGNFSYLKECGDE